MRGATVAEDRAECRRRWWYRGRDGKPCLPTSEGADEDLERLAYFEYRGVDELHTAVERMAPYSVLAHLVVTAMGSKEASEKRLTFGKAFEYACAHLKLPGRPPEEVEEAVLRTSFNVIASGRIEGFPDA